MGTGVHGNAMAEIALALAMAFFALMVLTLISMGAGQAASDIALPAGVTARDNQDPPHEEGPAEAVQADRLVIYYADRFFDAALRPIDPAAPPADAGARTVLALPPTLSLSQAMAASRRLGRHNATLTALNPEWMSRLREMSP